MTSEKLFSYGTLQYEKVQLGTFGRTLSGQEDTLVGYELSSVDVTDPHVIKLSDESVHKTLFYTGKTEHLTPGTVFEVTPEELVRADSYETKTYKRILVTLKSGTIAWVYISRAEELNHIIEVVDYDPTWPQQFQSEAELIKPLFGDNLAALYHIGSTAVPGLSAKPTIDMLLEVKNITLTDTANDAMKNVGYEAWGEYGMPGRRFFIKGKDKRTHHIHAFQTGNAEIKRHLDYRDYLIANPNAAKEYAALKIRLAENFRNNRRAYVEGKQDFIHEITPRQ